MICLACVNDDHARCGPVPHPDIEMQFLDCSCLHDSKPEQDEKIRNLLLQAQRKFGADDRSGMTDALRRILGIVDPPRGKLIDLGARIRGATATAEVAVREAPGKSSHETAAGLPEWMERP